MEISINHGAMGKSVLGLGDLPYRKRKALYRMHGCQIIPIAYFKSDEDAAWVEDFLRELALRANGTIPQS